MSNIHICGVTEVTSVIEQSGIKKLMSCLSDYRVVDMIYHFTPSVVSLDKEYWSSPENWCRLEMEDTPDPTKHDAPTMEEVIKGIEFGAKAISSNQLIIIHCQMGIARSPAMAIGSLLKAGRTVEQAYTEIKAIRPRMDPNTLIIKLLDEHMGLNGELIKYNDEYRSEFRKTLKGAYLEMISSYMHDGRSLNIIMEHITALDALHSKKSVNS